MISKRGSCRCNAVRFEARAPALLTMACHCKGCQRMTGSAFSLSEMYAGADFEVIAGEPVVGGMKASPEHYVCPECSSWLFTRVATPMGELVNVRTTMFESDALPAPFIETCTAEKLDWIELGTKHSFEKFPPPETFGALMEEFKEAQE